MPKNKFQEVIFTIIMVFFMVYAMICYNIALNKGGMTNEVFLLAFHELVISFYMDILQRRLLLESSIRQRQNNMKSFLLFHRLRYA